MMVDIRTQNYSTERTHQVASAERHEGKHQRRVFVLRRKERAPNRRGVIAEHHKVVHLEEISQRDANYGSDLAIAHIRMPSLLGILWELSLRRSSIFWANP